jgi:integrase
MSAAGLKAPKTRKSNVYQYNGRWYYEVKIVRPDGIVFRRHSSARSEIEAKRKRDAAFLEFNATQGIAQPTGHTVTNWAAFCLQHLWPNEIREKSLISYRENLTYHVLSRLGGVMIADVNPQMLQIFFNDLSDSHLSRGAVLKVKTVLSSLFTRAQERNLVASNPVHLVKIKNPKRHEVDEESGKDKRILTGEEIERLLDFSSGTYIHAAVLLGLRMGLRAGECLGLPWKNVDFDRNEIAVRQQVQRIVNKGLVLVPPKSPASVRRIPMPASVRAYLEQERKTSKSPFVVSNGSDKLLEPSRLRQIFNDCVDISRISGQQDDMGRYLPDPTFHDLRSTFLTEMANVHHIPPRALMQLAGHTSIEITLQYYVRASDESLAAAMQLVS